MNFLKEIRRWFSKKKFFKKEKLIEKTVKEEKKKIEETKEKIEKSWKNQINLEENKEDPNFGKFVEVVFKNLNLKLPGTTGDCEPKSLAEAMEVVKVIKRKFPEAIGNNGKSENSSVAKVPVPKVPKVKYYFKVVTPEKYEKLPDTFKKLFEQINIDGIQNIQKVETEEQKENLLSNFKRYFPQYKPENKKIVLKILSEIVKRPEFPEKKEIEEIIKNLKEQKVKKINNKREVQ